MSTVAFIGTGVMGAPMAANLLAAGFRLCIWNRTRSKAEPLVHKGAQFANSPGQAAENCATVITMVSDDAALREVTVGAEGVLPSLRAGAIHISMSTVSPGLVEELADAHARRGSELLCAPVFGSKAPAEKRKLWCVASGRQQAVERCRPLLDAMAQGVFYLGEKTALAAYMKLLGNLLIATTIAGLAQVFTAAARVGLPADTTRDVIAAVFGSPIYENYASRLALPDNAVHFPLKLMLKDAGLIMEMGGRLGVPLPLISAVREMLISAIGQGYGDSDSAASLLRTWERVAGSS